MGLRHLKPRKHTARSNFGMLVHLSVFLSFKSNIYRPQSRRNRRLCQGLFVSMSAPEVHTRPFCQRRFFEIKENLEFTLFSQKISTQPLTVLTMSAIVHLEQRKREKKKSSSDSFKIDTSDFSDSANITKSKLLFYERRYDL